jgi:hypothetical protein
MDEVSAGRFDLRVNAYHRIRMHKAVARNNSDVLLFGIILLPIDLETKVNYKTWILAHCSLIRHLVLPT